MNYHNITTDDMLNGSGLRVCLWCSGCEHHCDECQNPQTWDIKSGIEFDKEAEEELFKELSKDYISGITFTGGDPLHESNLTTIFSLCDKIKKYFPEKTIWIYTGFTFEQLFSNCSVDRLTETSALRQSIMKRADVLVDGMYEKDKFDLNYPWAGSTNQRVIDVQKSLSKGKIVLWDSK
ncbi:anaerobic ribonucleoside-triphosphate reductase activating protein [Mediterraneibacter sp. NSJ-55]|uniref:Anaerobic ribonucleoside-triphosphate reductase-activating protein n=1 Tax=Mediterraneibacter hominis TaxID=2763054 RepID=A0A923LG39_9FIRM|nr:anaerobic ribonucleoside-triphosphate reductase activating protein [Mediterraneibacter hominis]